MNESSNERGQPEVDITPFGRALMQLEIALDALTEKPTDALIRDAVIQRFEFTYELAMRTLRRYVRSIAFSQTEVDELTFKDLIRRSVELKLLQSDLSQWLVYRQARTDTVHTYNEYRAQEVATIARPFAREARLLFENITGRLNQ